MRLEKTLQFTMNAQFCGAESAELEASICEALLERAYGWNTSVVTLNGGIE